MVVEVPGLVANARRTPIRTISCPGLALRDFLTSGQPNAGTEPSILNVQKVMDDLNRVSNEVTSNITEIVRGMTSITESFHQVSAQTAKMGGMKEALNTAVEVFKI